MKETKSILLFAAFALLVNYSSGQIISYDYQSTAGWNFVDGGSPAPFNSPNSQTGTMAINSGSVQWHQIIGGGHDTRYWRPLSSSLSDTQWNAQFTVRLDEVGTTDANQRVSHNIFSLTSSSAIPFAQWNPQPWSPSSVGQATNHDAISVHLISSGNDINFQVMINDNGTITTS